MTDHNATTTVEEIHLALLQALPDGMCLIDPAGSIRFWNDAAETITGYSIAEAVCASRAIDVFFLSGSDGGPVTPQESATTALTRSGFIRHKDGHSVPVTVRHISVMGQNHIAIGVLHLFAVSEGSLRIADHIDAQPSWLRRQAAEPDSQAAHDLGRPAAVLVIRIDDFEVAEQRLGPEASEKIVSLVERTTANCLHSGDSCKRLPGGALLAATRSPVKIGELAERLRALIRSARLQWWGEAVAITVSIGATAVVAHDSVSDAARRAEDHALAARARGGNCVILSGPQ